MILSEIPTTQLIQDFITIKYAYELYLPLHKKYNSTQMIQSRKILIYIVLELGGRKDTAHNHSKKSQDEYDRLECGLIKSQKQNGRLLHNEIKENSRYILCDTCDDTCYHVIWMISGDFVTVPNRIWNVIVSLAKLECHIQSTIYTIRKQHPSITLSEIKNASRILQSSRIIQVNNKITSVTHTKKQFLLEITS